MKEFNDLLQLIESDTVKYGVNLPSELHTKLCLGQTRYVCRNGTLSEGHEKITDAQKYYQSFREIYYLSINITEQRTIAMEAQADYLDAESMSEETESKKLRKQAKMIRAKSAVTRALVTVQDQLRMLDEYNQVRLELAPAIEKKYPLGIEQAEFDNWMAVAKYRHMQKKEMTSVPLPMEVKAELGIYMGRPDMQAALMVAKEEEIRQLPTQSTNEYLGLLDKSKPIEQGRVN